MKYRSEGEDFKAAMTRIAQALKDSDEHFYAFRDALLDMRFLPAGRVQSSMGSPRATTPYNCFVSGVIEDSIDSIMDKVKESTQTMRLGGGIGYDFSRIRPKGHRIVSLDSLASGPVSFMGIFDSACKTISSAGHRRGAQMAVLRVDHPDIEGFVRAKQNSTALTAFNISVGVTDDFMRCVKDDRPFDLKFDGRVCRTVNSRHLWDSIMQSTYDWAEPGVLFLDTANRMNNLAYCEHLEATNPCAEQWLPPYGACLLGSFNLVKYLVRDHDGFYFDFAKFRRDIKSVVRAMDNIVDRAIYPLEQQWNEAYMKRRMGLGVTGVANAIEAMGHPYGSPTFKHVLDCVLNVLANYSYEVSTELAAEKGPFPFFERDKYLASVFVQGLSPDVQEAIYRRGIRNSHLTSIAPTGTISLTADNVSSGIEPVFAHSYTRLIQTFDGPRTETVEDYGLRVFGIRGKTASECSVDDHLGVLLTACKWIDSSVSKTCNVGDDVSYEDFKQIYMRAWEGGAKGCTTFRASGKRYGILNASTDDDEPQACFIDPETGTKTCE